MTISSTLESQNPINYQRIEDKIYALQRDAREYQKNLNTEAIWLFLATLGCWSVTNKWLQLFALILTIFLFGSRMKNGLREKKLDTMLPFAERARTLKDRIEQMSSTEDWRKERLFSILEELQTNELSTRAKVERNWVFIICWLFYGISLFYLTYSFLLDLFILLYKRSAMI
jgi:hypothetical protein